MGTPQYRKKAKLPPGWKTCLNCLKDFPPNPDPRAHRTGPTAPKFCKDACRKEFWKNRGVSVHKLKIFVAQWVAEEFQKLMPVAIEKALANEKAKAERARRFNT